MRPPIIPNLITKRIYQNGYIGETEAIFLKKQGITHILNLDSDYADRKKIENIGFEIKHIYVQDMVPLHTRTAIEIVSFIEESLTISANKIYVHCDAGFNRSPTAIWLYFLALGYGENEATQKINKVNSRLSAPDRILITNLDLKKIKNRFKSNLNKDE